MPTTRNRFLNRVARHSAGLGLVLIALLRIGVIYAQDPTDVWNIDSGPLDPQRYFGETVANGTIGIGTTAIPFRTERTLLYGAYETLWPGSVSSIPQSFDSLNLAFSIDGVRIERPEQLSRFHQTLRMKEAAFTGSFDVGDKATVSYTVRALRQLPYTALMEVTVIARRPIELSVQSLMEVPSATGAVPEFKHPPFLWLDDVKHFNAEVSLSAPAARSIELAAASAQGPSGRLSLAAAQSFVFDELPAAAPRIVPKDGTLSFSKKLSRASRYHFALVASTISSAHVADPVNQAQRLAVFAAVQGTQALIEAHERAWSGLWASDIRIDGDMLTQRNVHSMLYHLYSFIREGTGYSLSPMGLSRGSDGYMGHVFWDAEIWMFPALLALHPQLARGMLEYRYARLDAARRNAAMNGYRGAQFPWESAGSGEEDTWVWAPTGPLQIHVTADVGIAAWNYYRVTQDRAWLAERGYPLIQETADFWVSRVARHGQGHYDIEHVVGADEYAEDVNDDAFTNAAARANLAAATRAAQVLGIAPNPSWEEVRQNIPILTFADGVTREHASYQGEQIKQADVALLAYPLDAVTNPRAIQRDLKYYATRVDRGEGPAMTQAILAILTERLGAPDEAFRWFKAGYEPNQRPPFGVIAESARSDNPYFATAAGGLLQSLIYGFGGLQITDGGFVQRPAQLPSAWASLTLTGIGVHEQDYRVLRRNQAAR